MFKGKPGAPSNDDLMHPQMNEFFVQKVPSSQIVKQLMIPLNGLDRDFLNIPEVGNQQAVRYAIL